MSETETVKFSWKAYLIELDIKRKRAEERVWERRKEFGTVIYYIAMSVALVIIVSYFIWRAVSKT